MKRDLRGMANDPTNGKRNEDAFQQAVQQGFPNGFQPNDQDVKRVQDMAAQYSNKSQGELMEELMRTAALEKQKGTLNPAMLDQFFNTVGPMLTPEQRDRMANLINQIR